MTEAAQPDLDHPLVEIACRMLTPDAEEGWRFDDEAADLLERAILSQKSDPSLPGVVLGLFHVATDLVKEHGATAAAGRIFAVLGTVGPHLFPESAEVPQQLLDQIAAAQKVIGAQRALPPAHDAKPPQGTISARNLARPVIPPKRPNKPPKKKS